MTRHVAVIDIGKTNAKLALVDLAPRREVDALRRPNRPRTDGPYPHHDIDALWTFILDGLTELKKHHPIDAIVVTTHGATAALVDVHGDLVLPVLDYEFDGPDSLRTEYDAVRPAFAETGSPALPTGLNLGAQLFWLQKTFPATFSKADAILAYPQYWSRRLSGIAASEATSLGCHTDLWDPHRQRPSSLVKAMGWTGLFPPLRRAADRLGPLLPEIAARTGLDPETPVICGIHDSNASLFPHLIARKPPFAVVSTGTWVVAMAVGGRPVDLDPARDTLVNVDAFGDPVRSARFMGGREFETIMEGRNQDWTADDLQAVLSQDLMLLPSVKRGSGPFPGRSARWTPEEPESGRGVVAASFYLGLMTATCLELIGADGDIVVEGPLARNIPFLSMLTAATCRPVARHGNGGTGTGIGAALLAGARNAAPSAEEVIAVGEQAALRSYAERWRARVAAE